jgi:hypothetical protein
VSRRLDLASAEIEQASHYDYIVVNEEVALATAKIEAIITAEKCRPQRAAPNLWQEGNADEQADDRRADQVGEQQVRPGGFGS